MNTIIEAQGEGRTIGYSRSAYAKLPNAELQFHESNMEGIGNIPLSERPGLTRALDELTEGDTLLIESVDRLSRRVIEFAELCALISNKGAGLVSLE